MSFGEEVRQARLNMNFTLKALADYLEVTVSYIQHIEKDKRVFSKKKLFEFIYLCSQKNVSVNEELLFKVYVSNKKIDEKTLKKEYETYLSEQIDEQQFLSEFEKGSLKTHMFKSPEFNLKQTEYYKFPVNDLSFHLDDRNNTKFYGTIELDKSDIKLIDSLIAQVLKSKLENEKAHLKEIEKYEDKIFELKGKEFTPDTDIPKYAEDEHRINEGLEFLKNRGV